MLSTPRIIAGVAGAAMLGVVALANQGSNGSINVGTPPSSTVFEEEISGPVMTVTALATSLETEMVNASGDEIEARDVRCVTTDRTLSDGSGWYACSWRRAGNPVELVYTVEVGTSGSWNTSMAGGVVGPITNLSDKQVDQLLVDPYVVAAEQSQSQY